MEKSIKKRIKTEYEGIKKSFSSIPDKQLELLDSLMQNAAFMKVTLDELQKKIISNGLTDVYQNGANQYGNKASAELQAYNQLIKNYLNVQKQLTKLLPGEEKADYRETWNKLNSIDYDSEAEFILAKQKKALGLNLDT